jgi:hypothetical protein
MAPQENNSQSPSQSSSPSSSFPSNDPSSRKGMSEEGVIFNTFLLVIRNKFVATPSSPSHEGIGTSNSNSGAGLEKMKRLDELYKSSSYRAEKKKLEEMNNNGMVQGLAVGVVTFAFLRSGPRMMNRFLSSRSSSASRGTGTGNQGSGYQFNIRNRQQMTNQHPDIPRPGFFFRTVKFGVDVLVSMTAAMYGAAYFLDREKTMKELSNIPLLEGRSLISDELCDDFIDVYRSIPKKTWDKYDGKSEPLDAIGQFVRNCLRRKMVEKEILEQNKTFGSSFGMDDSEDDGHVDIPPPGVSADIEVDVQWIDRSEDRKFEREISIGDDGDDIIDDDPFQSDFDSGWSNEDKSGSTGDSYQDKGWR